MMFGESHHTVVVLMTALMVYFKDLSSTGGAQAWTYTYSSRPSRRWFEASQWCQEHYKGMVPIRSQEETDFLNDLLPYHPKYYWIGIHRADGAWIWEGSGEEVPEGVQNWSPMEPDNIAGQDCVEIYIKRDKSTGMWNNESCQRKKGTICYSASCLQDSCGAHADCVETVGNYTCQCHPGFQGPRCDEAITCKPLLDPGQGSQHCFHPHGPNRFNSSCNFHCKLGFRLEGAPQLLCQASGLWNSPVPLCRVQKCPVLNQTQIGAGSISCSPPDAPHSYNSTCEVRCDEGYEANGQNQLRCDHTGQWSASIPACTVKKCSPILFPFPGNMACVDTQEPFSLGSWCNFTCQEGYALIGDTTMACLTSGKWSGSAPTCAAARCVGLKAPRNSSFRCAGPLGEHSYGSTCTVRCDEGFDLIGPNSTECSSRGRWSSELPVCRVKKCSPIELPRGFLSCTAPHGGFSFGARCKSACEEGFVLTGAADTECTSQGKWSTETPQCLSQRCPLLAEAPPNGTLSCSHPRSHSSYGSLCKFECDAGFRLRGASAVTCNSSGLWSQDPPTCQPVQCEAIRVLPPSLAANCSHPVEHLRFGSQCFFSCKEGFSLNGPQTLTCASTGLWSDTPPTCIVLSAEGMPVGTALLVYTGVGAASAVALLGLIGLCLLAATRVKRGGDPIISEATAWGDKENPAFEF